MNNLIKIAENTDSKIIPVFNDQGIKYWSNNQAIDLLKKSGLSMKHYPLNINIDQKNGAISTHHFKCLPKAY
ncbi:MAG: hypothetical protein LRY43_01905 [Gammaproteobacteria bacterium]|nr:hypothetical protein [Gammaproteobacteria bacterium]